MSCAIPGAMAKPSHRGRKPNAIMQRLALCSVLVLFALPAAADGQISGGELRAMDANGKAAAPFPLRHTDVRASVSGGTASVTVEQTFQNPYDRGIEAVYVFPLPHESAVDDLEIRIGERIVRGEIHTRQAARDIYETAKAQGRVAALLDQERPNIFTQQVANIQPGHEIIVRIHYIESLKYADGAYEMVFPTVVGPRYIPGRPLGTGVTPAHFDPDARDGASGTQQGTGTSPDTDRVPDASRITPPVLPSGMRSGHDLMIDVDLEAGVPLQELTSVNHVVDVVRRGRDAARVRLRASDTVPNKDFVLRYRVAGSGPEFGVLSHRDPNAHNGLGFFTLQLQPEAEVTAAEARPKEMVFVLDTSGSMSGEPIAKCKAAMRWALQHLGPDDRFQIIRFSNTASPFGPRPVANTPDNIERALAYVEQLEGMGGTEMLSGIRAALDFPADPERLRLVCFMTDGYIGNETEIFAAVRERIGNARLFSFGIGSSVNHYLLDGLAEEGRGIVDYVALDADTRSVVERFYDRIAKPYLTDISIDWGALQVQDVDPVRLPDLFAGQPLTLAGRYRQGGRGEVVIRGKLGRRAFERRLRVVLPERDTDRAELGTLWARRHIDGLMRQMVQGEREDVVRQVTDTALEFRLVSNYTSFVAVDNQIVSSDGRPMLVPQPVEMPQGVSYEGVFGDAGSMSVDSRMGAASMPSAVRVRGDAKRDMSHGTISKEMPSWPVESVSEAVALNSGVVVQGGKLHVRGGRSNEVRIGLPPAMAGKPEADSHELLQVIVEAEQNAVRASKPIRLRIIVTNTSGQPIAIPKQLDLPDGSLQVRVSVAGQTLAAPPVAAGVQTFDTITLAPGGKQTFVVTLNAAGGYSIAVAGQYEIEVMGIGSTPLHTPARCVLTLRS